jgi:sirohydrochlorin ferrochelatase
MELAKPSIDDGIKSLIRSNVDEIICHPYFLSPSGRHVSTDIPNIIQTCMDELKKSHTRTQSIPPIRISEPVGANINLMMSAIDEQVRMVSDIYNTHPTNKIE